MKLREYLYKEAEIIQESIHDLGLFKSCFMAGNPGAGKTYVAKQISDGKINPKIVASDKWFRLFGDEWDKFWVKETGFKQKTDRLTESRLLNYFNGMLPIIVDSTSSNAESMLRRKNLLESLGYETSMIFVNTSLETSLKRVVSREKETGRRVPPELIGKFHRRIQSLKSTYKSSFHIFIEVNNDEGKLTDDTIKKAYKTMRSFFLSPIKNPTGKEILNRMKENGWTHLVPNIYSEEYLKSFSSLWHKE